MDGALLNIMDRLAGRRVLLVGDFMLDRYVFGDAERISPEAPVPVLRVVERQDRLGGAGFVALNVLALGAHVTCVGLVGGADGVPDAFGRRIRELLNESGADVDGLLVAGDARPTITKTRLVGLAEHRHRQQVLRIDDEVVRPPAAEDGARLLEHFRAAISACDIVCLEDYGKGVLSGEICAEVIRLASSTGRPTVVDPARVTWDKYRGASVMTPNRAELEHGLGRRVDETELPAAAGDPARRLNLAALIVTLGRDGALLVRPGGEPRRFPVRPRAVYDNTGAGDAVLAMTTVALAAAASLEQAVELANIAGGLEVSKFGCVPITRDEVLHELHQAREAGAGKLRRLPDLLAELQARRARGETIVFTNGCFDLLHPGHVDLLERARAEGSLLVVGLNSDASVRAQNKGGDRPIRGEQYRARMIAALAAVDYVVLFDEPSVLSLVRSIAPDVLVKGGDYGPEGVVGGDWVRSRGGRVVVTPLLEGFSTTSELDRIRAASQKR